MKDDPLEELLAQLAAASPPQGQAGMVVAVRNEIERQSGRRARAPIGPLHRWQGLLGRPAIALLALAAAFAAGAIPSLLLNRSHVTDLTRESLHFDVFTSRPPGMPGTVMALRLVDRETGDTP